MPGFVAFNRRWSIGGDDLFLPHVFELMLRLTWLLAIAIVFHLHKDAFDCTGGHLLRTYYIGILVILCCDIVLNSSIIYTSIQGTITNDRPRKRLPYLIYTKYILFVPEIVWNILGSYWGFDDSSNCESDVIVTVKGAVISGWILGFCVIVGILIVFDPLGKIQSSGTPRSPGQLESNDADQLIDGATGAAHKIWKYRCRLICCCAGCDEQHNNAFSEISQLFATFFTGVDLVPSDIAAGLILLENKQSTRRDQRLKLEEVTVETVSPNTLHPPISSSVTSQPLLSRIVDLGDEDESLDHIEASPASQSSSTIIRHESAPSWMRVSQVAHYMRFASASYGWPLHVFSNPLTGACRLYGDCSCCICGDISNVVNDNCCTCHLATIVNVAQIKQTDIIYASFHNKIYEIPFFVAVDHKQRSVVVAVRGTLSLRDVMTDLCCDSETIDIPGVEGTQAHKGILGAAKFIQKVLQDRHLLDMAFLRGMDYSLVICGHSLGAGAAALLAVLLKPKYPDLRCYAYSAPGGLMSLALSKYTQSFVCSVILGNDLVPRLGMVTIDDLKIDLLHEIKNCDKPKHHILARGCWKILCSSPDHQTEAQRHLLDDSGCSSYNSCSEDSIQDALLRSTQNRVKSIKTLYPPGKILHIIEERPKQHCCGIPTYTIVWTSAEAFDHIVISPKMLSDHMPDTVQKALDQLVEQGRRFPKYRTVDRPNDAREDAQTDTCVV